jgi:CO/xanthine dehydrogenase FAD-binding subunit
MIETWRPQTLAEALEIRRRRRAIPCAGGTDLMVRHRRGAGLLPAFPADVLLLDGVRELRRIEAGAEGLRIGAGCTLADLLASPLTPEVLRRAVREMAAPAIRNRATLAGNVCNASPAGDTLPPLYVLEARVRLAGARGEREVPIERFITGPGRTVLAEDELLLEVIIPPCDCERVYYRKAGARRANALAKVSAAALAALEGGRLWRVRIALGAVAPVVVRSRPIEQSLEGRPAAELDPQEAARAYEPLLRPIDDQRSTAAYRRRVALNMIGEFLRLCRQGESRA